jgi:hypothetical protein
MSANLDKGGPGVRVSTLSAVFTNEVLLNTVNSSLIQHYTGGSKIHNVRPPGAGDLNLLTKWHQRTVFTIGSPDTSLIYRVEISRLASLVGQPWLCSVIGIREAHDHFLASLLDACSPGHDSYARPLPTVAEIDRHVQQHSH